MNWYKLSQVIIDPLSQEEMTEDPTGLKPGGKHYMEIGHGAHQGNFTAEDYIWLWKDGELEVVEAAWGNEHKDLWKDSDMYYKGRAEIKPDITRVSVSIPRLRRFRKLPYALYAALKQQWGTDENNETRNVEIYVWR